MFAGAFFGFKQQLKEPPVRTNEIPRQIPLQAWYMSAPFTMLIGGILPFGAVFIERIQYRRERKQADDAPPSRLSNNINDRMAARKARVEAARKKAEQRGER